jgi:hypothetical protein
MAAVAGKDQIHPCELTLFLRTEMILGLIREF